MKFLKFALVAAVLALASPAKASVIDFTGYYDVSNWSQDLNGGYVYLGGAPYSILEISNDSGGGAANTDFYITAQASGWVTFDWLYNSYDVDGASWDPFGYIINGMYTQLTDDMGPDNQSGTATFWVNVGDVFGFRAKSVDSAFGSGVTKISQFSVPAPAGIALLGLSLLALRLRRK